MTTRSEFIAAARSQLGVAYQHGASLKDVACDCIGLLLIACDICGRTEGKEFRNDIRFKGYGRPPNARLLIQACDAYLDRIPSKSDALPGDIVLGRVEIEPQHFGILTGIYPPYVIHAYGQLNKVAENRADERWQSKMLRVYRLRGIE